MNPSRAKPIPSRSSTQNELRCLISLESSQLTEHKGEAQRRAAGYPEANPNNAATLVRVSMSPASTMLEPLTRLRGERVPGRHLLWSQGCWKNWTRRRTTQIRILLDPSSRTRVAKRFCLWRIVSKATFTLEDYLWGLAADQGFPENLTIPVRRASKKRPQELAQAQDSENLSPRS
jgi:hypothetical protein